jgi:hypothetical protein
MSDWGASGSAVVREKSDVAKAVARLNDDTAPLWDLTIASEFFLFCFVCLGHGILSSARLQLP